MTEINIEKADGTLVSLNSKKPLRAVKSAVMKDELMGGYRYPDGGVRGTH